MEHTNRYDSLDELLHDRIRWARAVAAHEACDEIRGRIRLRSQALPAALRVGSLDWLVDRLDLATVEIDAVWLLVCAEIDPEPSAELTQASWARLVAMATGEPLASGQLDRLVEHALVETSFEPTLPMTRRTVRANDRVVELARGEARLDRVLGTVGCIVELTEKSDTDAALARSFSTALHRPLVVATGAPGSGRRTALRAAISHIARGVLEIDARELATDPSLLVRQLRAIRRDARLFGVVPLFFELDAIHSPQLELLEREILRGFPGPVAATSSSSLTIRARPLVHHAIALPPASKRIAVWRSALPATAASVVGDAADRYSLTPGAIVASARAAAATRAGDTTAVQLDDIHCAVRAQLGDRLAGTCTRVSVSQTWDDLVLPAEAFEQLVEIAARVRHRSQVLDTWGFGAKVGKGRGVSALFSGPPGTGKTMVAGLIANELGLDLYAVDLSRVISKYIGETEKNLSVVFDAAECGEIVLLFDEADSLFGKRTEVKSSNDRHANQEVNYLLQRLERFDGVCLLTTNHESAIDEAFRRRLSSHVRFPLPDEEQRAGLWSALIPSAADVDPNLDFARLGQELEMSGGYIKNAVLRAAFAAADQQSPITMEHLVRAARSECEAMGKVMHGM